MCCAISSAASIKETESRVQVAVVEANPASLPAAWRPVTLADLAGQAFEPPEHAALLADWLRSSGPGQVPALVHRCRKALLLGLVVEDQTAERFGGSRSARFFAFVHRPVADRADCLP